MSEREVNILELWMAIKKNIIIILIVTLLFGALGWALSTFVITPLYQSTATIIVGRPENYQNNPNAGIEYNDILASQKLVGTYGEIMKSQTVLSQVNNNLALEMKLDSLSRKIQVSTVNNTEIISVTATDPIPEKAMDIVNETTSIFIDEVQSIMRIDNVQVLDPGQYPEGPVSPNIRLYTMAGLFLGLFLSLFIAVLKEIVNTKIKSVEDYRATFDIPLIGIIPKK